MRPSLRAVIAAITLLVCPPAARAFTSADDVHRWMGGYRSAQEPQRLPDAIRALGAAGVLKPERRAGLATGFVAGILSENPDLSSSLLARMFPLAPEDQPVVILGLAYSGLPDWKERLEGLVERLPAHKVLLSKVLFGKPARMIDLPLDHSTGVIDMMWGFYLATGNVGAIGRILQALPWVSEPRDLKRKVIGNLARLSLTENAILDKSLLEQLKVQAGAHPPPLGPLVGAIVAAADKRDTAAFRGELEAALAAFKSLKSAAQK